MLPHYCLDLPHRVLGQAESIRRAFELLGDARSRQEFLAQLRFRLLGDFDGLPHPVAEQQYLAADLFGYNDDEAFVDGGAYDGDTLRSYLCARPGFASYMALEPDPANCKALRQYVASLPARSANESRCCHSRRTHPASEWESREWIRGGRACPDGSCRERHRRPMRPIGRAACRPANELPKAGHRRSGARGNQGWFGSIQRDRPVIAVCVYHSQDHLWRLPLLIDSSSHDYRFHLRPYNEEGWDLVCYAVPQERSLSTDKPNAQREIGPAAMRSLRRASSNSALSSDI